MQDVQPLKRATDLWLQICCSECRSLSAFVVRDRFWPAGLKDEVDYWADDLVYSSGAEPRRAMGNRQLLSFRLRALCR